MGTFRLTGIGAEESEVVEAEAAEAVVGLEVVFVAGRGTR
jgi:hypothetical protein